MRRKISIVIFTFCLPLMLIAEQRTIRVGSETSTIKVEEGKIQSETKPSEGEDVHIIPYDKYLDYGIIPLTFDEIKDMYPEEVISEPDPSSPGESWSYYLLKRAVMNQYNYEIGVEIYTGTSRSGALPHFADLIFNWRYNKIEYNNLHEGSDYHGYKYSYPANPISTPFPVVNSLRFIWPSNPRTGFLHRASSGHAGYSNLNPGDPIWYKMKTKGFTVITNVVW